MANWSLPFISVTNGENFWGAILRAWIRLNMVAKEGGLPLAILCKISIKENILQGLWCSNDLVGLLLLCQLCFLVGLLCFGLDRGVFLFRFRVG